MTKRAADETHAMILKPWMRVTVFVASLGAPFVPLGGTSFFTWMCGYTVDTVSGMTSGYIQAYCLCWLAIMLPLAVVEHLMMPPLKKDGGEDEGDETPRKR